MSGPRAAVAIVETTAAPRFVRASDTCPDPEYLENHTALDVAVTETLYGSMPSTATLGFIQEHSGEFVAEAPVGTMLIVSAREYDGDFYAFRWVGIDTSGNDVSIEENPDIDSAVGLPTNTGDLRRAFSDGEIAKCGEAHGFFRLDDDVFSDGFFTDVEDICTPNRPPNSSTEGSTSTESDHVERD